MLREEDAGWLPTTPEPCTGSMAEPAMLNPALTESHPENLPYKFLPKVTFAQSHCLFHILTLLSDSSNKPRALLVLTTYMVPFSSFIIHRSQLAYLQIPPFCNVLGGDLATCLTP